ncbi:dicarboxylate/amino acid:cation symporter [Altericroceibacterium endophyticum]|uniref:Cation:dicarboxylase symporter family transporter n=1 Tax=Altericroceibacterium endophyticum TaxID=1808508 RepID=A0A6I4T410_9SPHN|nr:dicarboxylate/amino acid:cation symporter [Altericroceibacterium endophyticum]MXO65049.1 cation:dicarboxylase symporter family transporter [Altericroceibacterium endophyticum]
MVRPSAVDMVPPLKLPAGLTFAALLAGLLLGWLFAESNILPPVLAVAGPIGRLWLSALQMTIIPLVASLMIIGIVKMVDTAKAGAIARRTLTGIIGILAAGTLVAAFLVPFLLNVFPIPGAADAALQISDVTPQEIPGIGAFLESLIAPNVVAAAAETAMLPVIVFFACLALAIARLPREQHDGLMNLFEALAAAMLIVIGWVLRVAPLGVFALAIGVSARSGGDAIAALGHYILLVSSMGLLVLIAAYPVARLLGGQTLTSFARAILPAQAVALSTQSSLASLPAMLASCRTLGIRETTSDFVLPLAVAIFRATSPAMNLAVAIYVAKLSGVPLTPATIAAGAAVALITTLGSVSLPGAVSFVTSIGPIALAMGVPVGPLALLVAVEMLPDLMRTVANVTMDVALAGAVDRRSDSALEEVMHEN